MKNSGIPKGKDNTQPKIKYAGINKGTRKILSLGLIIVYLCSLPVAYYFFTVMANNKAETKEMAEIAEQFQPNPEWEFLWERQNDVVLFDCSIFRECAGVWKTWKTDQPVSGVELQQLADAANWDLNFIGKCETDGPHDYHGCSDREDTKYYAKGITVYSPDESTYLIILTIDKTYSIE